MMNVDVTQACVGRLLRPLLHVSAAQRPERGVCVRGRLQTLSGMIEAV